MYYKQTYVLKNNPAYSNTTKTFMKGFQLLLPLLYNKIYYQQLYNTFVIQMYYIIIHSLLITVD